MSLRVLHVLPTRASSYGGPVRVAESLARHTEAHGISSTIFPPDGVETNPKLLFAPAPGQWLTLLSEVRRAELVHVHGLWTAPTSAAAAMARSFRKPYVLTPHGMLDRWSMRRSAAKKRLYARAVERRTLSGAAAIHFFNEEEAAEARAFGALPPSFELPNGVDVSGFAALPGRAELLRRFSVRGDLRIALFLGRVHSKKGFDVLLPALAAVVGTLLVVAGPDEGGYRREVERLAAELSVTDRVVFVGPVEGEDKRTLLGGSDFFVLPSHQEGDSVAIKEALAAGLPVLISNRCHFHEVEREGAGLVVNDDPAAVTGALRGLSALSSEARRAKSEAARRLAGRYDAAALGARMARIYRALARGEALPS